MEADDWFTITELASRLGSLVWIEDQLASVLAHWSAIESHAPSAVLFAQAGQHHRWHATTIRDCLPTSPQLRETEVEQSPTAGWTAAINTLRGLTDPDATAARLKALTKVVDPWLDREIAALLDVSRPISDAAMMRWLRFVAIDHGADGHAAQQLVAARSLDAVRVDDHLAISELDLS